MKIQIFQGKIDIKATRSELHITDNRLKEAEETGADYLVTICPTCEFNFDKVIRNYNIKLLDLIDIIDMAIDENIEIQRGY